MWAKRFGGTSTEQANTVTMDGSGNIAIGGSLRDPVDFGGGGVSYSGGSDDAFVAKFTAAGAHMWSRAYGDGFADQNVDGVAMDAAGKVTVTGSFSGQINFGGGTLNSHGLNDGFLASFTP
jgi:hypothetical protein